VIAIGNSELMTIRKAFQFGTADRDEFGIDDRDRLGMSAGRRWTSNKAF
jgi:hypothetical protein